MAAIVLIAITTSLSHLLQTVVATTIVSIVRLMHMINGQLHGHGPAA